VPGASKNDFTWLLRGGTPIERVDPSVKKGQQVEAKVEVEGLVKKTFPSVREYNVDIVSLALGTTEV